MPITEIAGRYLMALQTNEEIPGGLAYPKALAQLGMDWSMESLHRVDALLDQIREKQKPTHEEFLGDPAKQNFLNVLCFYTGMTVAKNSGQAIEWYRWEEVVPGNPGLEQVWPRAFETSVICTLTKDGRQKQFLPFVPIVIRLFEGPDEKSVHFSASGFL